MHKGDLETGMLKQWPTLDVTCSNRYQFRAHRDEVKSHVIQPAWDNIVELSDLHHFESDAEYLEFIDSILAHSKYLFPVTEHVEGGVSGPNPMPTESKAANQVLASTLPPGGNNPTGYLHQIISSGE